MKERAYLTIYRRWMKKEKQKKNRRKTDLMEKYHAGLFLYHSFLFLLIYINITVQCIFGDSEIICNLISGFCNKESTCII